MEPWERLPKETPQAWEAFKAYRDLGDSRSNQKVGEALGKSRTLMDRWSTRHDWVNRVRAWDSMLSREERRAFVQERHKMAGRHAHYSMMMQQRLVDSLQKVNPEALSNAEIPRWIDIAVKVERLSRGMSTENVGVYSSEEVELLLDAVADLVAGLAHHVREEGRDAYLEDLEQGLARILGTTSGEFGPQAGSPD